jgi:hypothetical protein
VTFEPAGEPHRTRWNAGRSRVALVVVVLVCFPARSLAQTHAVLQGRIFDATAALVAGATVTIHNDRTGLTTSVSSDREGRYHVPAVPAAIYRVTVEAAGFRTTNIEALHVDAGRTVVRDFHLAVGDRTDTVVVRAEVPLVDRATATVGHVVTAQTIQDIPLNGRHFIDLGLLVPGSVAPSQTGFSARPIRGVGSLAFNTAGNREEAVGFMVNGVSSNNLTFGSLIFEPPLGSIEEFRVDSSAFAAAHGHVSGAIVSIVTRSGGDEFRGEATAFVRNDALDARNFFELTSRDPHPYERHQFGGSLGGPISRGRRFFFVAYEGLRQRQGIDMNSLVLSDAERAAASDPVVQQLIPLIPRGNFIDEDGTSRFIGSAPAVVDTNRWTIDVRHNTGRNGRFQVFYGQQHVRSVEPTGQGNSIPGFGLLQHPSSSLLTVGETHLFGTTLVTEARVGRMHLHGGTFPAAPLNPAEFGIGNGVTRAIGLPQMIVAGSLNFGGPGPLPQGRIDTSYVFADTITRVSGRHSIMAGGEYRHFINENVAEGTGVFNFPTVAAFLAGTANAFTINLGERRSVIDQRAMSLFLQDHVTLHDRLTLSLGVRYEWHVTPTERNDRFVVFDAARASLLRVGIDVDDIHAQNNRNVEPRLGVAWTISADARTVLRAAYAHAADQPGTTAVRDTAGNPPFSVPLTAAGPIQLASAIDVVRPAGLAPATVDPAFRNALLQSWNVNVQRQLATDMAASVGYLGSRGRHLRISRNINQPVRGVRPFPALSASSPVLPGTPLGNITQVESSGFSNYHGAWLSLTKRLSRGLHVDAAYTWSKSLDTNSLNSSGFAVQDSYDIPNQYGLSDFDARHRFVLGASYILPFTGRFLTRGWQISAVVQSQSGNPVNIVTANSSLNGTANTVRPDVSGPIRIVGAVDEWFDPSVFVAVDRFGNLARNTVSGPAFHNTDLSVVKTLRPGGRHALQFRLDVFDLFNHPNFGPPGNVVGSPTFGKISRTRLPTGEAGSSRQIQLGARLSF